MNGDWICGHVRQNGKSARIGLRVESGIKHHDVSGHPIVDIAPESDDSGAVELNWRGLSDVEGDVKCLGQTEGINMMLDVILIRKANGASHGNDREGREKLAVLLNNLQLDRGRRIFLSRLLYPNNSAFHGATGLIFHRHANVRGDGLVARKEKSHQQGKS
jgi:hypothetical protein